MHKRIRAGLLLLFIALLVAGCAREAAPAPFTSKNEILTYQKPDARKTQITVSFTGNIYLGDLVRAFEVANPDVQVFTQDITGGVSGCAPLVDWVTRGNAPDVVFTMARYFTDEQTMEAFENLSADPVLENYEAAALRRTATNDDVYWLPGPSNITAMMYNKTLFEQYGWKVPRTFDEFVALCAQITKDTNGEVEPWNPNAKYSNELTTAMEAFTYGELFGGVENRAWYNNLANGKATFSAHMAPYCQALQTLAENGILKETHFTYSATARGKEFAAGKIAMINMSVYDADNDLYSFGYMPFPATKGTLGYLCDNYACYVGLAKKQRTEAQNLAAHRFINYFSSQEGQAAFIGKGLKVSNVKNVTLSRTNELAELQSAINEGHLFAMMDFLNYNISLHTAAFDIVTGKRTMEACLRDADNALLSKPGAAAPAPAKVVAAAQKDFTMLETSFYIADAYRAAANADIALIAHGVAYRGNLMRIFSGEITPAYLSTLKPRSFANGSTLMKATLTGRQLLDALNHPAGENGEVNCVYAYSGLKCEIAPWNEPGQKYLSVKLANGEAIDPDKTYAVAAWQGTLPEACFAQAEAVAGTFEEIITAKMQADQTLLPANDGRAALVWS